MKRESFWVRGGWVAAVLIALALPGSAETKSLLILHTNDLHARIRPGHDSLGGMPYVSGYIHQVREQRQDVLALDAGDVTEKGDMLSFMTHNTIMYEAMNEAGYDAAVPGNHDMRDPLYLGDGIEAAPKISFVCMNCFRENPRIKPSDIFTVNGVRVAVIGLTVKTGDDANSTVNDSDLLERLVKEVGRVTPLSDIQVILCHLGSKTCLEIAKRVPDVDLYVSGHTHELLEKPIYTDSGAMIVQTGEYAQHVGRVDLQVDVDTDKIVQADVSLVTMDHSAIPCDKKLLEHIEERTQAVCPEAKRVITRCDNAMDSDALGPLAAEALRRSAKADVSLFSAPFMFRADFPKGDINIGDIFLAGGFRGYKIITVPLTGKEIESYLSPKPTAEKTDQSWAGFEAKIERDKTGSAWKINSSLEPEKHYSVVIPALEWEKRFPQAAAGNAVQPCSFSFTDSVVDYITANIPKETALDAYVKSMPGNN